MTIVSLTAAAASLMLLAAPAYATNSPIELKTALETLMRWLPGQFDSEPQRFFEAEYKTPANQQHGRVYRSFARIDAPAIGENVLVATVRYGGKDGQFDNGEFQVWTLAVDPARKAIRMAPQRFKEPGNYIAIARDEDKLRGLSPDALVPAEGAASCVIWWRLYGSQLQGKSEPGACATMSTGAKTKLNWEWEWLLNDQELWLNFAGRDAAGRIASGRADQVPWRLGKARDFECFLSYRPARGEPQVNNGFVMHDRGDIYRWQLKEGRTTTPVFAELIRGMWPSNSGRNYIDLLRFTVYQGKPEDPPESWVALGNSHTSSGSDRAGFQGENLSGRCKVR